ncbi:hypothetical protein Kisp01_44900 [Kineosporia sp. NBRC 101677]|nr:hypothetical protein Kisp01_44900 [Kineosporia sp. NBRC 101677]
MLEPACGEKYCETGGNRVVSDARYLWGPGAPVMQEGRRKAVAGEVPLGVDVFHLTVSGALAGANVVQRERVRSHVGFCPAPAEQGNEREEGAPR